MDSSDGKIFSYQLASSVGKAVSEFLSSHPEIPGDRVDIGADVVKPTMYLDEDGVPHSGRVVLVDVRFSVMDDDDDDDDDDD